jgi:hypothetical protein
MQNKMKNVYLLPTDKPSRLIIYSTLLNELRLLKEPITDWKHKRNIYITDDSEIKEGDWCLLDNNVGLSTGYEVLKCLKANVEDGEYDFYNGNFSFNTGRCKKVILTTDQDLIKDGVQPIDDTFLEWFVKNPSCERVEISHGLLKPFQSIDKGYMIHLPDNKVLEEPKQYPIGGYAPGYYSCKCVTCQEVFQGDKRAVQCEPCAIKMTQKELVMLTQEQIEIEIIKCKKSPYYFATKYLTVKNHKGEYIKFQTPLTEKEFNNKFKQ